MIQKGSFLTVVDNSGAKKVLCIKIIGSSTKRYASIGDTIFVSVKALRSKRRAFSKVKKGEVLKALIIRTKKENKNNFKQNYSFFQNNVILLNKQNKLIGTRIFGSIPFFFRFSKYMRIIALSSGIAHL